MPSERIQRRIDALLDEADQAMVRRAWEEVRARCDAVLAFDPENADARAYLAAAERGAAGGGQPAALAEHQAVQPNRAPLPAAFANGRYTVLGLLGEGGKKVVYRVRDTVLKREVAFSLIKTDGLDDAGRERVRREAEMLAQLGAHPHIVTVFDLGAEGNRPYLVSELLPGGDLDALLRAAPEHRLPVDRVLSIGTAIAEALAFAHAQGVVHRDLKPGNVWLAADGTAKLGDFGLAIASERSRLTQVGMVVGTVAYMPPEQALGGPATPQADLYSLGCLLYELITGRPPFLADDPTAVITQHLNTAPVAPSWFSSSCPPDLERLVLQLLAKRPEQRPPSATAVVEALARIDPAQRSASHSDPGSNPLDRLARGVFVGRESELARLRSACDQAFTGQGGLVMLVGEPGIGKTRTTRELETYARLRGAGVLWGQNHEESGAPAYWPWIQIGRQWGAGHDPTTLATQLGSAGAELTRLFPELAQVPGMPPLPEREPQAAQFALFDAFVQFLRMASAQQPLLLVLDDLHWADKPTLQLLQHLAPELERMRVLVAATYRDTDLSRTHPLAQALAALNRTSGFSRIVLRGLSKDEVASYVATAAGAQVSPALLAKLYEETEGNPFFLSEVVNLLTEEGTLSAEKVSDIRVPDGVKEALGRRLDRLSAETTALLQVAAIIGREFAYDTLTLLHDEDEEALLKHIEAAVAARVIEELPRAGRYRFTHALMQETLLGELSTTRKVRLHGQVGEALEKRWGAEAESRAPRLAQHFGEAATLSARHAGKAVRYAKLAAEQAEATTAWAEAARYYEQVLTLLTGGETGTDADEAALYMALGRCYQFSFEMRPAWRNFMRAVTLYRERGDGRGFARVALATTEMTAPPDRQLALFDEAVRLLGEDDPYLEASLLANRTSLEIGTPANEQAAARAAELAVTHNFADVSARLSFWGAMRAIGEGRFADAITKLSASHVPLALVGDGRLAAFALSNAVPAIVNAGWLHDGEAQAERALTYSRSIHQHEVEQAAAEFLTGIAIARSDNDHVTTLLSALDPATLGGCMMRCTRLELADDVGSAVAQLPSPALAGNVDWPLLIAHGVRARVRFNAGDNDGARRELAAWYEVLTEFLQGPTNATAIFIMPTILPIVDDALVQLAGEEQARAVYEQLQRWPELRCSAYLAQGVDHLRGDLALRLELAGEAEAHYRTGLAWGEREGVPVERGRCLLGLAEIALRQGDAAGALQQIAKAARVFEDANIPLYLRQAEARRAEVEAMNSPVESAPVAVSAEAVDIRLEALQDAAPDARATTGAPVPRNAEPSSSAAPVFISYASDDRARASGLAARLEAAGHAVWLDRRSIAGGASWDAEIVRGIRESSLVAVLISERSVHSPNVQQELRLALEYRKPLLPLILQHAEYPDEVKYILAGRQWVEILDQPEAAWLALVRAAIERLQAR